MTQVTQPFLNFNIINILIECFILRSISNKNSTKLWQGPDDLPIINRTAVSDSTPRGPDIQIPFENHQ